MAIKSVNAKIRCCVFRPRPHPRFFSHYTTPPSLPSLRVHFRYKFPFHVQHATHPFITNRKCIELTPISPNGKMEIRIHALRTAHQKLFLCNVHCTYIYFHFCFIFWMENEFGEYRRYFVQMHFTNWNSLNILPISMRFSVHLMRKCIWKQFEIGSRSRTGTRHESTRNWIVVGAKN